MPGSVITSGGSARSLGGSVRSDTNGLGCCCGECPFFYRAVACVDGGCLPQSGLIYVCSTLACPSNPNPSGYGGPIQNGTIVKYQGACYRVQTGTIFCPASNPPPGCVPLPVGAITVNVVDSCWTTCQPPHCNPVDGYFQLWYCSCGVPSTASNYYVSCMFYYQKVAEGFPCPIFAGLPGCLYVKPGSAPLPTIPPGGFPWSSLTVLHTCCECCPSVGGAECCNCSLNSKLTIWSDCGTNETETPRPCTSWSTATATLLGCGYEFREQIINFQTGQTCPVQLDCYEAIGGGLVRHTVYTFLGDCTPGNPVGCCGFRQPYAVQGTPEPEILDYSGCTMPVPVLPPTVPGGASPPCCPSGQRLQTCTQSQINFFQPGATITCPGQRVTAFGAFARSSGGGCGNDCAGTGLSPNLPLGGDGLVFLDGSPAIPGIVTGGCAGCGGAKGEAV